MGQSHYTVYVEIFTMKKVSAILPRALIGENCRGYGDVYRIDDHQIFLQYKGSWNW